jgi:hypothetical protein
MLSNNWSKEENIAPIKEFKGARSLPSSPAFESPLIEVTVAVIWICESIGQLH